MATYYPSSSKNLAMTLGCFVSESKSSLTSSGNSSRDKTLAGQNSLPVRFVGSVFKFSKVQKGKEICLHVVWFHISYPNFWWGSFRVWLPLFCLLNLSKHGLWRTGTFTRKWNICIGWYFWPIWTSPQFWLVLGGRYWSIRSVSFSNGGSTYSTLTQIFRRAISCTSKQIN